jgi:hypothetical protein
MLHLAVSSNNTTARSENPIRAETPSISTRNPQHQYQRHAPPWRFPRRSGVLDGHAFESSFGIRGYLFASARLDQTREEWFGLPLRADQWCGSF